MATQECWRNKKQGMKILGITEKKRKFLVVIMQVFSFKGLI